MTLSFSEMITTSFTSSSSSLSTVDKGEGDAALDAGGLDVCVQDPLEDSSWDDTVTTHSEASPFHAAAWGRVLLESYGHRLLYLRFEHCGRLAALLPLAEVNSPLTGRRAVSLPFVDSCPPLYFQAGVEQMVLTSLQSFAREGRWRHVELRGVTGEPSAEIPTYYQHELSFEGADAVDLFSRFAPATRRAVRKAQRLGLQAEVSRTPEAMEQFLELHALTRRTHGAPPQPAGFMWALYRHYIECGNGFLSVVKERGKPVAAAVILRFGTSAIYKFGASDPASRAGRPNNLALWEAIRTLVQEGVRSLHFGRTGPDQVGLRRFKRGWGAMERPLNYIRFDVARNAWFPLAPSLPGLANRVFAALPLSASRVAGSLIYPHLS